MPEYRSSERYGSKRVLWLIAIILISLTLLTRFGHLAFIDPLKFSDKAGLFLEFSRQIWLNNYAIPDEIPYYSTDGVPFLYPPLGFYIMAIFIYELGIDSFIVINVFPPILSAASVLIFYFLSARVFSGNKYLAFTATFAYILLPNALHEQVDTEGFAEALGTIASTFFLLASVRIFQFPTNINSALLGVSVGLGVLLSPGSAFALTASCFPLAILFGIANKNTPLLVVRLLSIAAVISIIIVLPYAIHVLESLDTFVLAFSENAGRSYARAFADFLVNPVVFNSDGQAVVWSFLFFWGALLCLLDWRILWIPIWSVFIIVLVPREASWLVAPGVALTCGIALHSLSETLMNRSVALYGKSFFGASISMVVAFYLIIQFPLYSPLRVVLGMDKDQTEAMNKWPEAQSAFFWLRDNSPDDAVVIFVGNPIIREWSAHIAQREVINIPEGTELDPYDPQKMDWWISPDAFLRDCSEGSACLDSLASVLKLENIPFLVMEDYLLLQILGPEFMKTSDRVVRFGEWSIVRP